LTGRPEAVVLEDSRGARQLAGLWPESEHRAAWSSSPNRSCLARGCGHACRQRHPLRADSVKPVLLSACVQEACSQVFAAHTLEAAVGLGRNVLVTGPRAAAVELMLALVGSGSETGPGRPLADLAPERWALLSSLRDVRDFAPDRLAAGLVASSERAAARIRVGSGRVHPLRRGSIRR